jgi:hypothetical protein
VYDTISPFTEENGYAIASAYANGKVVDSIGGGICQVSTTLYNAIIRAEVEVTMRYNHSMLVSYVDPSDDAAIASGIKDFQFVNNLEYPIYIEGYCSDGWITMNVYGYETRPSNRTISFESEVLSEVDPQVSYTLSDEYDAGTWKVMQSEHRGTEARLWKIVTVDGVEQSRDVFNTSTYRESPKEVTIGTKGGSETWLAAVKAAINDGSDEDSVRAVVNAASTMVDEEEPGSEEETDTGETPDETESDTSNKKNDKNKDKNKDKNNDKNQDADKENNSNATEDETPQEPEEDSSEETSGSTTEETTDSTTGE